MHPVQIAVLIALVSGTIAYSGYRIRRDIRAQREFFRALVDQLSRVLLPKGFRLTQSADFSKSVSGTVARFDGRVFSLEVFWDIIDRELTLLQLGAAEPPSQRLRIGIASFPLFAKPAQFAKATADIVEAAARSDATPFLKPARFEVHNVFQITNHGRVVSGTIVAGRFRVGTRVWAEHTPGVSFTISGVGFLDDRTNQRSWVTLLSEDAPPLIELREVLATGSILTDADPVAGGT